MPELPLWQNAKTSVSGSASNDAEPRSNTSIKNMRITTSKTSQSNLIALGLIKKIQLGNQEKAWYYAAIDVDSKLVLHARLPKHRGRDPAEQFLTDLKKKHYVEDAEFLVDGMGYLTALARTDLSADLNYTERNIFHKLFQIYTMRIQRFHETWNGSQPVLSAG